MEDEEDDSTADGNPAGVGDGRPKHVTVTPNAGDPVRHDEVYLRHARDAFLVSPDAEFPPEATTRYEKADLERVEVDSHRSRCFVTTAVAGDDATLDPLRSFRDDVLARSVAGRLLVALYERLSPPLARTLARQPDAPTTRVVRRLVEVCAALARGRRSPARSLALVALYWLGLSVALLGHLRSLGSRALAAATGRAGAARADPED